jgi:hypothetical protein
VDRLAVVDKVIDALGQNHIAGDGEIQDLDISPWCCLGSRADP